MPHERESSYTKAKGQQPFLPTESADAGQQETKEGSETFASIDCWYWRVIRNSDLDLDPKNPSSERLEEMMLEALKRENPTLLSVTMERTCNLQCSHCLFPQEKSSEALSKKVKLPEILLNLIRQLPTEEDGPRYERPQFLHEGRILRKWHLDIFEKIRILRPDVAIGMIDNGTYTTFLDDFLARGIKLDWLDISIDGTEESHDRQRDPENRRAYQNAVHGLRHAREVTLPRKEGGRVTSLLTLTNINYADIAEVADFLFSPNPEESAYDETSGIQLAYADEFRMTTMGPYLEPSFELEISKEEFKEAWNQIKKISTKYNTPEKQRVYLVIYRDEDFEKLAYAAGEKTVYEALTNIKDKDTADIGEIWCMIDGVPVSYFPTSIWPQESILVDSDGAYRVAHSQKYTLAEHQAGKARDGSDISGYTVETLTPESSYQEVFETGVNRWWENFGKYYLIREAALFKRIREKAEAENKS